MTSLRAMLASLSPRHRIGKAMLVGTIVALLAQWLTIVFFLVPRYGSLTFLRLHYNQDFGVDWVAEWWKLFVYPGLGAAAVLVNVPAAAAIGRTQATMGHAMLFLTLVVESALAAGGIMAVMLNS
ncbi:MAG: hypothetical protein AAB692_03860 [Patescibacteria group bacterium]